MIFKKRKRFHDGTIRLKGWDYRAESSYFVTINSAERGIPVFGRIENGRVILSSIGKIIEETWKDIPNHFPMAVLDEFVIMPDHVHGIITLINPNHSKWLSEYINHYRNYATYAEYYSKISPKKGSLGSVVRSFKSAVTKRVNEELGKNLFRWQSRYYDVIIKDNRQLKIIRRYIKNNPKKFRNDL